MRSTRSEGRPIRWILLANLTVALLVSGAALVLLLIAPLGMAAVLSCTGLVGLLSFVLGLVADLLLLLRLGSRHSGTIPQPHTGWSEGAGQGSAAGQLPGATPRLPDHRQR